MPTETEERVGLVFNDVICITGDGAVTVTLTDERGEAHTLRFLINSDLIGATNPIPLGTVEYEGQQWFARYSLQSSCKGRLELDPR